MDPVSDKILLILALCCVASHGYPNGAPKDACNNMFPGHRAQQQPGSSNVSISLSSNNYTCGDVISVTFSNAPLKGFICQARLQKDTYETTGKLEGQGFKNNCDQPGSITQADGSEKSDVMFLWKPDSNAGNVTIVCSIVKKYSTFWVKETSSEIINTSNENCTTLNGSSSIVPFLGTNGAAQCNVSIVVILMLCAKTLPL